MGSKNSRDFSLDTGEGRKGENPKTSREKPLTITSVRSIGKDIGIWGGLARRKKTYMEGVRKTRENKLSPFRVRGRSFWGGIRREKRDVHLVQT